MAMVFVFERMRNLKTFIVLTAVGLIAGSASAAVLPGVKIPAMVNASELIVVGRANQTVGVSDGSSETFLIRADRILKNSGSIPQGPLVVRLDMSNPDYHAWVAEGEYGIFFLRRLGPNQPYTAVDPYHPVVAASPIPDTSTPNLQNPLASVTRELVKVLTTPGSTLLDPITGVQDLAVGTPDVQLSWLNFYVAQALKSIPYETVGPPLRAIATSGSISARLWALDSLLSISKSDEIEAVKLNALSSVEPILLNPTPDLMFSVSLVGKEMLGQFRASPAAVPQLAALLSSSEPSVRVAAAGNLSFIGNSTVIAPLAKLALHDQNPDVRYYAVLGLAKASGARVWPTREAFNAGETDMLHSWDEWAKVNVH
jgi:HEAT repeats